MRVRNLIGLLFIALAAPSVAFAAEGAAPVFDQGQALSSVINFIVYAGLLYVMIGKPLRTYFAQRRTTLLAEMEEAAQLKASAEEQLSVYSAKLDQFELEREQILREFREIGELERDRLIEDGRAQAERMKADASRQLDTEVRGLRQELVKRLVEDAIAQARGEIASKLSADSQKRFVEERLQSVAAEASTQVH